MLLLESERNPDPVTKPEFERRADEMKARNLARRQFRSLRPPRSIFAPPLALAPPEKVYVCDFLRAADIGRLGPPLSAIRKLGTLETDRDGLLDCKEAGLGIFVSPDLLARGIKVYDAILKAAADRRWPVSMTEGSNLRIIIGGEPFELAITEKTDPVPEVRWPPHRARF